MYTSIDFDLGFLLATKETCVEGKFYVKWPIRGHNWSYIFQNILVCGER